MDGKQFGLRPLLGKPVKPQKRHFNPSGGPSTDKILLVSVARATVDGEASHANPPTVDSHEKSIHFPPLFKFPLMGPKLMSKKININFRPKSC